jgi:hypothetical protein
MDWGILTAIVAAFFAAVGLALGYFLSKFLSEKEEKEDRLDAVEERVSEIGEKISEIAERIKEALFNLREDKVADLKGEVAFLEEALSQLSGEVKQLPLTPSSLEALDRAFLLLKEIDFNLPEIDPTLFTQIKDSLIILRNDVQTLLQLEREKPTKPELPELDELQLSVSTALRLARDINRALVRGELLSLAASLKGDTGSQLVKELDEQSLASKELVLILEKVKKELDEVGR